MSFLGFWWAAIRHAFTKGWIALGAMNLLASVFIPALVRWLPKHYQDLLGDGGTAIWLISVATFVLIVAGRIVYAPYSLYRERDERASQSERSLRHELDEEQSKRNPKLSGEMDRVVIGNTEIHNLGILVLLKITNSGAPTAVEGFGLRIRSSVLTTETEIRPTLISEEVTVGLGSPNEEVIKPEQAIYRKSIFPLVTGGLERGWLKYIIQTDLLAEDLIKTGPQLTISLEDITGRKLPIDFIFQGTPQSEKRQQMYYPRT